MRALELSRVPEMEFAAGIELRRQSKMMARKELGSAKKTS
jgi:hypothetical protein